MRPYYERDGVAIYCGDCVEVVDAVPSFGPSVLVLTDPPYSSGARRDSERQVRGSMLRAERDEEWFSHDAMTTWGFSWFVRAIFVRLRRKLPRGSHLYSFIDWRQMPNLYGCFEASGLRVNHGLVWDKGQLGMGTYWRNQHEHVVFASCGAPSPMLRKDRGSVVRCSPVSPARRVHPTEKPVELMRWFVDSAPGDLVLDPFCGRGPALVAAKAAGRRAIGVDTEERYCEMAARLLDATPAVYPATGVRRRSVAPTSAPD